MAHLEALGIDIDTSNVLRVRDNTKYYKILGVLVVDLISGAWKSYWTMTMAQ